jgi:hypothetical protein
MSQIGNRVRNLVRSAGRRLSPGLADDIRLARYIKKWVLPRDSGTKEFYVPGNVVGHDGFDLYLDDQLARIRRWRETTYQGLFRQLREDSSINTGCNGQSFGTVALHNGYYPTPDAEIYAAMILDFRPKEVVEIGSGFSTLIARRAIGYGKTGSKLTVIDIEPRTDVRAAADEVILSFVEDTNLAGRTWDPSTILFIDSSHICRSRGDLPLLFCKVLPNLPAGMVVHVHDIFLPYDYPTNYDELCYTEQYLLHCLLSGSSRYRTILSTYNLSRNHPAEMQQTFGEKVGRDPLFPGASYWFEVTKQ